jgi:hypothetical protein
MGIKQLFQLIGDHAPCAVSRVGPEVLARARVGIDFGTVVHRAAKARVVVDAALHERFVFGDQRHVDMIVQAMVQLAQRFEHVTWLMDNPGGNPAKHHETARRANTARRAVELRTERGDALARVAAMDAQVLLQLRAASVAALAPTSPPPAMLGDLRGALGPDLADKVLSGMPLDVAIANKQVFAAGQEFQGHKVGSTIIRAVRAGLTSHGQDSIVAPHGVEAEQLGASLQARGRIEYVVSEDMDTLCFGAGRLLCKDDGRAFQCVDLSLVLAGMQLTMPEFVDLCILCGSDFTDETIPRIGPKTAFKLIAAHRTIEQVMADRAVAESPRFDYGAARRQFMMPVPYDDILWA